VQLFLVQHSVPVINTAPLDLHLSLPPLLVRPHPVYHTPGAQGPSVVLGHGCAVVNITSGIVIYTVLILMLLIGVTPSTWPKPFSSQHWIHTDEEGKIDDQDGHHPEDDDDHNLDGGDRPGLMLAHTPWAELVYLLWIKAKYRLNNMFTVTICRANSGVNIYLPSWPVNYHIRIQCLDFWAFTATPVIHMIVCCAGGCMEQHHYYCH